MIACKNKSNIRPLRPGQEMIELYKKWVRSSEHYGYFWYPIFVYRQFLMRSIRMSFIP